MEKAIRPEIVLRKPFGIIGIGFSAKKRLPKSLQIPQKLGQRNKERLLMRTSENIDKLAPALLAAQSQIGNATKNAKNPHFRNNYADLGSVIDAVKEPLNKAGIAILQSLSEGADGLHLTTRLLHTSGQFIEDTAFTPLPKNDPQGVGSATTYLRRYSLAALLCITQEDDDGVAAMPAKPAPAKAPVKAEAPKPANDDPF